MTDDRQWTMTDRRRMTNNNRRTTDKMLNDRQPTNDGRRTNRDERRVTIDMRKTTKNVTTPTECVVSFSPRPPVINDDWFDGRFELACITVTSTHYLSFIIDVGGSGGDGRERRWMEGNEVNHCVSYARAYFMHRLFLLFGCILRVIFVNRNRSIFRRQHNGPQLFQDLPDINRLF